MEDRLPQKVAKVSALDALASRCATDRTLLERFAAASSGIVDGCASAEISPQLAAMALLLPKVELHAHLNGSISPQLINALVEEKKAAAPPVAPPVATAQMMTGISGTAAELNALPDAASRMKFCFRIFDTIYSVVTSARATQLAVQDMLLHYAVENTLYLEVRSNLRPLDGGVDRRGYLETVCRAISNVRAGHLLAIPPCAAADDSEEAAMSVLATYPAAFDLLHAQLGAAATPPPRGDSVALINALRKRLAAMTVKLIVSINRGVEVQAAEETVAIVADLLRDNPTRTVHGVQICGLDFCGNCYKNAFSDFEPTLQRARRELGLGVTLHAGEKVDADELRRMVAFGPERYGHLVFTDEAAIEAIQRSGAPVEVCLSSNLVTSAGDGHSLRDHHLFEHWFCFSRMLAAVDKPIAEAHCDCEKSDAAHRRCRGHRVSINTDDRGVFYTSMTRELLLLAREAVRRKAIAAPATVEGDAARLLWAVSRRAIDDAFCSDGERRLLAAAFDKMATGDF